MGDEELLNYIVIDWGIRFGSPVSAVKRLLELLLTTKPEI
jgi:hypothetical protein